MEWCRGHKNMGVSWEGVVECHPVVEGCRGHKGVTVSWKGVVGSIVDDKCRGRVSWVSSWETVSWEGVVGSIVGDMSWRGVVGDI